MKKYLAAIILLLVVTIISCNRDSIVGTSPQDNLSNITIGLSMAKAPSDIARITAILSRAGYDTLYADFVIYNDSAVCRFDNIPIGMWHLRVNAYNSSDTLKYSGEADVNIIAGVTTPVYLTLNPVTGSINITVTWQQNSGTNLIANPSFEFNGQPSLTGWTINDTSWAKLKMDAPAGEGNWCLSLFPAVGPMPGGTATAIITGQEGKASYTLSFYEKNNAKYYWGFVRVEQYRKGNIVYSANVTADTAVWSKFNKTFEVNLLTSDTLSITLGSMSLILKPGSGGKINIDSSGVLYDGVSFIKY